MKALIIEDEKAALRNLKALLKEVAPEIEIAGEADSITDTIEWLQTHPMPELIFMDIHLADGSAFEIFSHIEITCPVIFTTAYDEYALRAFKVNSVDYLLKPIDNQDMIRALEKLESLSRHKETRQPDYTAILNGLKKQESYKTHFLIPVRGDKLLPLPVGSVLFFFIDEGVIKCISDDNNQYTLTQTLDEIAEQLDPASFFRINRQFLVAKKAIRDIDLWFNGRLAVNLTVHTGERILVSKARAGEFKEWFTR